MEPEPWAAAICNRLESRAHVNACGCVHVVCIHIPNTRSKLYRYNEAQAATVVRRIRTPSPELLYALRRLYVCLYLQPSESRHLAMLSSKYSNRNRSQRFCDTRANVVYLDFWPGKLQTCRSLRGTTFLKYRYTFCGKAELWLVVGFLFCYTLFNRRFQNSCYISMYSEKHVFRSHVTFHVFRIHVEFMYSEFSEYTLFLILSEFTGVPPISIIII